MYVNSLSHVTQQPVCLICWELGWQTGWTLDHQFVNVLVRDNSFGLNSDSVVRVRDDDDP